MKHPYRCTVDTHPKPRGARFRATRRLERLDRRRRRLVGAAADVGVGDARALGPHLVVRIGLGCECAGLTMRGSALLVFDTIEKTHATRRQLVEQLNFGPTLAFTKSPGAIATPSMSAIAEALPPNVNGEIKFFESLWKFCKHGVNLKFQNSVRMHSQIVVELVQNRLGF